MLTVAGAAYRVILVEVDSVQTYSIASPNGFSPSEDGVIARLDSLALATSASIEYTLQLVEGVEAGSTVTAIAGLRYASHPSVTSGTDYKREYATASSVQVTITTAELDISLSLASDAFATAADRFTSGTTVEVTVELVVPEGNTTDLVLNLDLTG